MVVTHRQESAYHYVLLYLNDNLFLFVIKYKP